MYDLIRSWRLQLLVPSASLRSLLPAFPAEPGMAGIYRLGGRGNRDSRSVFIDYQNVYHYAREAFGDPQADPPTFGHVRPHRLGLLPPARCSRPASRPTPANGVRQPTSWSSPPPATAAPGPTARPKSRAGPHPVGAPAAWRGQQLSCDRSGRSHNQRTDEHLYE